MTKSRYSVGEFNKIKNKIDLLLNNNLKFIKSKHNFNEEVINSIINSKLDYSITGESLTIVFYGAKLFTTNKIFALLQSQKYVLFKYKKVWHNKVKEALNIISKEAKFKRFGNEIDIELFRSAKRTVDEDAMMTMFKYIIDGLRFDKYSNPNGVITDDSKNFIKNIKCHNVKSDPNVGIKILTSKIKHNEVSIEAFLKK